MWHFQKSNKGKILIPGEKDKREKNNSSIYLCRVLFISGCSLLWIRQFTAETRKRFSPSVPVHMSHDCAASGFFNDLEINLEILLYCASWLAPNLLLFSTACIVHPTSWCIRTQHRAEEGKYMEEFLYLWSSVVFPNGNYPGPSYYTKDGHTHRINIRKVSHFGLSTWLEWLTNYGKSFVILRKLILLAYILFKLSLWSATLVSHDGLLMDGLLIWIIWGTIDHLRSSP